MSRHPIRRVSNNRAVFESVEKRLFLSAAAATWSTAPLITYKSHLTTPFGYSSPNGEPATPAKMRNAYGLGTVGSSPITFNGVQGDGTGQTIAIVEAGKDPNIASDLAAFDSYWSLPAPPTFLQLNQTGGTDLSGVSINSGVVGELDLDVEWAHVMAPNASIILFDGNNLYTCMSTAAAYSGVCAISISYGISGVQGTSQFATPSGHAGVTFLASTGDTGGEVTDPSMSPAVVAVGGTSLSFSGTSYGSESAWSAGGGGINQYEGQPSYQTGVVSAWSTTQRTVPDISLDADPNTGVAVYDSYNNGTSSPWDLVGGTSLSAPLMAGIVAVVDQGRASAGLTSLDGYTQTLPRLYKLPGADFHDITTGNNTHPATVGYDLASGIGSPIANKLVYDLAGADTLTGRVFNDLNGDGTFNGSDTGLANKTVYLDLNKSGVQTSSDPTALTNASGVYTFSDQIGSETGIVRLATGSVPAGTVHTTTTGNTAFVTSYGQTQTFNFGFIANPYTAVANPTTVTGTATTLSANGTDPSDGAIFLYTWSATTSPSGASVVFSANGTNAAKSVTATFNKAGNYTFTLSVSDAQGSTVTSTVNVTVIQVLTTIILTPTSSNVPLSGTTQLTATAYDQFNNAFTVQPSFAYTIDNGGVGSVNASGLYSAPSSGGGAATARATSGAISGSTLLTVVPNEVDGTSGDDTIRLVRSGSNLLVYVNGGSPVYNVSYSALSTLKIVSGTGNDVVNVDFSGGSTPVPASGLTVNSGTNSGLDTLIVTGTNSNDTATVNSGTVRFNGSPITYGNIGSIIINGNGGADSLTQNAQPGNSATLQFNGGTSGGPSSLDTLNVNNGNYVFPAPVAGGGIQPIALSSLSIGTDTVSLGTAASHADRYVFTVAIFGSSGRLDLGGNDLVLHLSPLLSIQQMVASGYASGAWNGIGISSSAAATDSTHNSALGVIQNISGTGAKLYSTFDGQVVATADILVKYTFVGDTNLDGVVDGSDYSNLDNGFLNTLTGWFNGDFNYDSVIDGSDYTLIDNTFNTQGASLASAIATSQAVTAGSPGYSSTKQALVSSPVPPSIFASSRVASTDTASDSLFWKWYAESKN